MDKKKLQLSEIKIKSIVTLVDKVEQKTAKGGYIQGKGEAIGVVVIDVADTPTWTEYKTRISSDIGSSLLGGKRPNEDNLG